MTNDPYTTDACARVRERLPALADGALSELDAARDAGHLEACAACAAERDALADLLGATRDALGPAPDWRADLAGLDARLAAATPPRRPWTWRVLGPEGDRRALPVLAAAAALLLLVAAAGLGWLDGPLDDFTSARPWDRALPTLPPLDAGAFGLDTAEDPR